MNGCSLRELYYGLKNDATNPSNGRMKCALGARAARWEQGSDIVFVGGGVAAVVAAIAFTLRSSHVEDRRP